MPLAGRADFGGQAQARNQGVRRVPWMARMALMQAPSLFRFGSTRFTSFAPREATASVVPKIFGHTKLDAPSLVGRRSCTRRSPAVCFALGWCQGIHAQDTGGPSPR